MTDNIEATKGTLTGEVLELHHLALKPNGWNWQITGKSDIERLLHVLEHGGNDLFEGFSTTYPVTVKLDMPSTVIEISNIQTRTFESVELTEAGRAQLIEMCKKALGQEENR